MRKILFTLLLMTSINCFSQANEVSLKLFDLTIFQTERVGLEKFSYISKDTFFCNYIILKNPVLECNSTGLFLNAGLMNSDFYKSIEWCKYRDTLFVNHIIDYFSYINVSRVYNDLHIFGTFNKDSIKLSTQINNLTTNINVYPNLVIQNLNIRSENLENVKIYSISGILIFEDITKEIDMSNFKNGVYLVKIKNQIFKIFK